MLAAVGQALLHGRDPPVAAVGTAIMAPLILASPGAVGGGQFESVVLGAEVQYGTGAAKLRTGTTVHVATQYMHVGSGSALSWLPACSAVEPVLAGCSEPLATHYVYERLASAGLQYGPAFRRLRSIKQGAGGAAAQLMQQPSMAQAEFLMDPAMLDSCLQLGGLVSGPNQSQAGGTFIPAALDALCLGVAIGGGDALAAARRPAAVPDTEQAVVRDHSITAASGAVVCRLHGLTSKATSRAAGPARAGVKEDMLYGIDWLAAQPASMAAAGLADLGTLGFSAQNSAQLAAASMAALQGALAQAAGGIELATASQHVVHAAPAGQQGSSLASQLWGLVRTTAQECPALAVAGTDADILSRSGERTQLRVHSNMPPSAFDGYGTAAMSGVGYAPSMERSTAHSMPPPFQLLPMPRGSLNSLAPVAIQTRPILNGQVLLEVRAIGINFRQVAGWMRKLGACLVGAHAVLTPSAALHGWLLIARCPRSA
jgi:hypothetical protein